MDNILIELRNIFYKKNNNNILDNVSLSIEKEDFITIIGPNGAGKSLLLKCLIGAESPTSGHIQKQPSLCMGYMPQKFICHELMPLKVSRFLALNQKTSLEFLSDIAAQTKISSFLDQYLFNLSGGEMQRVLLARALLRRPDVLILDEPAQNLDLSGQLSFYALLSDLYQKHKFAIIMVSHDLQLVMASCKKVICLYHHICCSGAPQNVTKDPKFQSLFGADMAKMMAIYQHKHNHSHEEGSEC